MALIDKTSIGTGNTIQAEHITRIIDALNESGSYEIIATGSFTGSFVGDASGLTGITSAATASYAHYAVSASYEINYETSSSYADTSISASHSVTADTASYINVSNIDGEVIATTASYVETAQTASYITAANIDGTVATATSASYALTASYVETAQTASYVLGSNVSGTVATATSSSYSTDAKQLTGTTRTVYTFTTTNATPYNIFVAGWLPGSNASRYIKATVVGRSGTSALGGVITKVIDLTLPSTETTIFTDGIISNNFSGTPTFNVGFEICQAIGLAATTINWKVIIEYFQIL